MLTFNEWGLLPEGIHRINLAEFQKIFAFNEKRKDMIAKGLIPFLKELAPYRAKEAYLNGSFVTDDENPDDIDGYLITDTARKLFSFMLDQQEHWQMDYRVDIHPALTDFEGQYSKAWWESRFAKAIGFPKEKKGYISLEIP